MAAQYGAHEVMEIHEVLATEIDAINTFQLYRPHVQDPQLAQILDNQLQFMTNGYHSFVQLLGGQGMNQAVPYRAPKNVAPVYGLRQPAPVAPNTSMQQMDDRDVACAMLNCHKSGASKKMLAALECADPQIRRTLQECAINCSEQAYEVWQYMNQKGYYQVPTMKEVTTQTMLNTFTAPFIGEAGQPSSMRQLPQRF
ncbi:spore coat protein CotF [Paenibacillus phyllosphaerae]|uniref:Spore coat protein CotF n=1 Tax=Paenibacillus phyllosphaerae TaxID=274593 RepID=A0A7W5B1M3_9BACL|nr:spore coat protein [Paenibacillus phyllosphaerae]MBB3112743.1 spore coat protein CotF [Paenibacillus phyllosphaerae]